MHYKKTEEYRFHVPREYKASLEFKDRLKEMGIKYYEEHGGMDITVRTYAHGDFDISDNFDILKLASGR